MEKFVSLIEKCKANIALTVNEHRESYQSVAECMESYHKADLDTIDADIYERMVATDTMVVLVFYPETPVGAYVVYHYDVELAAEAALSVFAED